MKQVYAPGCALMIYKPELATRVLQVLNKDLEKITKHLICCRHEPKLKSGTQVINTCAGCDRRYRELYEGISKYWPKVKRFYSLIITVWKCPYMMPVPHALKKEFILQSESF